MAKLLIIADDFTGALDTGVQFAASGAVTQVVTNYEYDIDQLEPNVQVLVMDAETRHLSGVEAGQIVYSIVSRACKAGIPYIYKKTDSALRGNIGSELTAALEASGKDMLHFLPAYPSMKRTTVGGKHYIDGVPVQESVFGQDPFEPVTCSSLVDMIHEQSQVNVRLKSTEHTAKIMEALKAEHEKLSHTEETEAQRWEHWLEDENQKRKPHIVVYDAETNEDMQDWAKLLGETNNLHLLAGCAGFASFLPKLLELEGEGQPMPEFGDKFLVACGSVNPITKKQLDYAENHGFTRIRVTPEQKLEENFFDTEKGQACLAEWIQICKTTERCIIDTNDLPGTNDTLDYAGAHGLTIEDVRYRISTTLGCVVKKLVKAGVQSTMLLTGGDTLLGFMNQMKVYEIQPVCEMAPGTVLSVFKIGDKNYSVISKSGGFGEEDLMVTLANEILKGRDKSC